MSNPIHIIKEDHENIKNLFTTYTGYTENDIEQKKKTAHDILQVLSVHMKMEEKFFYPRLASVVESSVTKEAEAEHHAAKMLIMELKMMPVSSDTYDAKMKVLEEAIMHHVEEEESKMLPEADKLSEESLEEIGKHMEEYHGHAHEDLFEKLLGK